MSDLPLARYTLVEVNDRAVPLCLRLATSLAAKIAADLGADVLKVEPPGGDPVRRAPPMLSRGESALFQFLNTSKRAVMLDLEREPGRAALQALLAKADAVLFEEPAPIAALARSGRATPIEIAAFPLEMNAAGRPVRTQVEAAPEVARNSRRLVLMPFPFAQGRCYFCVAACLATSWALW